MPPSRLPSGEAGMGFAVVAERCADNSPAECPGAKARRRSSRRTSPSQEGEAWPEGEGFSEEIFRRAPEVSELVYEIAAASQEQAQGIEQIDKAIQQMDQVTRAPPPTGGERRCLGTVEWALGGEHEEAVQNLLMLVSLARLRAAGVFPDAEA
jgi:methyl-accepting chemotaxis protein